MPPRHWLPERPCYRAFGLGRERRKYARARSWHRHDKYFYRFFRRYNACEENGRFSVLMALGRRLLDMRNAVFHHTG